jgi:lysophospholipid acyltransferase (LPLAT)-like uncharacterized protein
VATWMDKFNGYGLYWIAQMTRRSGRFQTCGMEHLAAAQASGRPIILTAWHGMTMMLVGFFSNFYDTARLVLLMPDDWRGAALEIFSSKLGAEPYPMNLHAEGGMATARRLAELVRKVKGGRDAYITPDGPEGPAYVIKPGIAFIAQKANALIVPIGAYCRHGYRMPRWDRYVIPYPFSSIAIHIGAPLAVEKGADLTAVTHHLTNVLHRVTAQAAADYYETPREQRNQAAD